MAHQTLGSTYLLKRQYEQATTEVERAISLAPSWANGYIALADILLMSGRAEEAFGPIAQAMRLDPKSVDFFSFELGFAYRVTGRYKEAIAAFKKVLARTPNHLYAHLNLAAAYSQSGQEEEARAEVAEVLRLSPNFSLEMLRQVTPQKDPAIVERTIEALRKAGLK